MMIQNDKFIIEVQNDVRVKITNLTGDGQVMFISKAAAFDLKDLLSMVLQIPERSE